MRTGVQEDEERSKRSDSREGRPPVSYAKVDQNFKRLKLEISMDFDESSGKSSQHLAVNANEQTEDN
jgi:hypothetical protein